MTTAHKTTAAIARIWRGRTTAAKADDYERYWIEKSEPLFKAAVSVEMLREDRGEESEFVTISYWESIEAMSRFAGPDPRRIHHLARDADFLIELPEEVQILKVVKRVPQKVSQGGGRPRRRAERSANRVPGGPEWDRAGPNGPAATR